MWQGLQVWWRWWKFSSSPPWCTECQASPPPPSSSFRVWHSAWRARRTPHAAPSTAGVAANVQKTLPSIDAWRTEGRHRRGRAAILSGQKVHGHPRHGHPQAVTKITLPSSCGVASKHLVWQDSEPIFCRSSRRGVHGAFCKSATCHNSSVTTGVSWGHYHHPAAGRAQDVVGCWQKRCQAVLMHVLGRSGYSMPCDSAVVALDDRKPTRASRRIVEAF